MSPLPYWNRRRTVLVNPRLQAGTGLLFAAVVLAGGALFAWTFYRGTREALWAASLRGHFWFDTPYQVVGGQALRQLAILFAASAAAGILAFLLLVRKIRAGMAGLRESLRRSGEGDLSSPTNAPGLRDLSIFGRRLDAVREDTLDRIREIRAEVGVLRKEPLPLEEFRRRWEELKAMIGRIAP